MSPAGSMNPAGRRRIGVSLSLLALLSAAVPAAGQEDQTGLRLGGIRLTPSASIVQGLDSNPTNGQDPKQDWQTISSLGLEARTRAGVAGIRARSVLDSMYYRTNTGLRSFGVRQEVQGEFYLSRLRPFVVQSFGNVRTPFSLEIDLPVRRKELGTTIGADVKLTALTTLRGQVDRRETDFANDALYRGQELSASLNYASKAAQVSLLHDLTALTRLSVTAQIFRDQFRFDSWKNSNSFQVASGVVFQPDAVISGSATVGYRRLAFVDPVAPSFVGLVGSADLKYTLLSSTQFGVHISRDVPYSLSNLAPYFVSLMFGVSVTHAFRDKWEVEGGWGNDVMAYQSLSSIAGVTAPPPGIGPRTDRIREYTARIQRRITPRLRVGVNLHTIEHQSPDPLYEYRKFRTDTTIIYGF